jgi:hypothetical protein
VFFSSRFRVTDFTFNLVPFSLLVFSVLARTSGRENRLVHIREDSVGVMKENTVDFQ